MQGVHHQPGPAAVGCSRAGPQLPAGPEAATCGCAHLLLQLRQHGRHFRVVGHGVGRVLAAQQDERPAGVAQRAAVKGGVEGAQVPAGRQWQQSRVSASKCPQHAQSVATATACNDRCSACLTARPSPPAPPAPAARPGAAPRWGRARPHRIPPACLRHASRGTGRAVSAGTKRGRLKGRCPQCGRQLAIQRTVEQDGGLLPWRLHRVVHVGLPCQEGVGVSACRAEWAGPGWGKTMGVGGSCNGLSTAGSQRSRWLRRRADCKRHKAWAPRTNNHVDAVGPRLLSQVEVRLVAQVADQHNRLGALGPRRRHAPRQRLRRRAGARCWRREGAVLGCSMLINLVQAC